ncbi:hypothetical protein ABZX92_18955 [Lentzea sp. NPDC006480]|uniref:hypothetical protein n=1 Tax=Lentzea sp. NPDC006480 TaxID=3157176 RepID=UPI0033A1C3F4
MARILAVLAACLFLGGCADWPPYAVRTGPHGGVEIVYANCDRETEKLVQIAFVVVEGDTYDENEPRIWQLDFPTPTALTSVEVGQTPQGAVETIPYRRPDPQQPVNVVIAYDERTHASEEVFTLDELDDGKTLYHYKWRSPKEFDERCD